MGDQEALDELRDLFTYTDSLGNLRKISYIKDARTPVEQQPAKRSKLRGTRVKQELPETDVGYSSGSAGGSVLGSDARVPSPECPADAASQQPDTIPAPHAPLVAAVCMETAPSKEVETFLAEKWAVVESEIDAKKRQAELELNEVQEKRQRLESELEKGSERLVQVNEEINRKLRQAEHELDIVCHKKIEMDTELEKGMSKLNAMQQKLMLLERDMKKHEAAAAEAAAKSAATNAEAAAKSAAINALVMHASDATMPAAVRQPVATTLAVVNRARIDKSNAKALLMSKIEESVVPSSEGSTPVRREVFPTTSSTPPSTPATHAGSGVTTLSPDSVPAGSELTPSERVSDRDDSKCSAETRFTSSTHPEAWGALYRIVRKVDTDGNPACAKEIYDAWHQGQKIDYSFLSMGWSMKHRRCIYDRTIIKYLVQVKDDVEQGDEQMQMLESEMQNLGLFNTEFSLGDIIGDDDDEQKPEDIPRKKTKLPEYPEVEGEESLQEYLGQYKRACLSRKALFKTTRDKLSEPGAGKGYE
ncbi:unnamed protein product [Durusdinium trenchii]|uniref:Uncharacterized protein n=1 Tax=Durusdinium trenchii TaxID=1381693 RepID=A0ABP0P9F4_9DINO